MSDMELAVRRFLAERTGTGLERIDPSTRLDEDLGLFGGEVDDLVRDLAKVFRIDIREYRWHYHADEEQRTPLSWILAPRQRRVPRIPLRTRDLVESARRGSWSIAYPDTDIVPRPEIRSLLTTAALVALIVVVFLLLPS